MEQKVKELINLKEGHKVELKTAENELPKTFWETYSAFSNTEGGIVYLGIEENKKGKNNILGVKNCEKIKKALWDNLSNTNKVNYRTINNEDVEILDIEGKKIIVIRVNEAPNNRKPVYINGNIKCTFIRTGDGDRLAKDSEIKALISNSSNSIDSELLNNFYMSDLDDETIQAYKGRVDKREKRFGYLKLSNEEFLEKIGVIRIDRKDGKKKITTGGLLFFGKYFSIKDKYLNYHLDYFNRKGNNNRWKDRVASDEFPLKEMNIYNFYTIVSEKLFLSVETAFELNKNKERLNMNDLQDSLREALVNSLVHADYSLPFPTVKIEVYDGWTSFSNPGKMLISKEEFIHGGISQPRNEILMSLFRKMGISERQGWGGPQIYQSAIKNKCRTPELETDLEKTFIRIWNIDLVDSHPELTENEKKVFKIIVKNKAGMKKSEIMEKSKLSVYKASQALNSLKEKELISVYGKGKSTQYTVKFGSEEHKIQIKFLMEELLSTL